MSDQPTSPNGSVQRLLMTVRADAQRLAGFVAAALNAAGASLTDTGVTAEVLVRTDLRGVHTHGVQQLPSHVRNLLGGGTSSPVQVEIVRETPVTAALDGHGGMGTSSQRGR